MLNEGQFLYRCSPPPVETFSCRQRPCRFEMGSQPPKNTNRDEPCPYRTYCNQSAVPLKRFEQVYSPYIKVTMAEESSSIVVRSETQYNKRDRQRLGLRKHFHELYSTSSSAGGRWAPYEITEDVCNAFQKAELLPPSVLEGVLQKLRSIPREYDRQKFESALDQALAGVTPDDLKRCKRLLLRQSSSALACHQIETSDVFGRYLGFLDLRPYWTASPVAMGLLVPPRAYRSDPDVFVITGDYGELFGAQSFPCTVYSMQDFSSSGAFCTQACTIMLLGMLADRVAEIKGTYTLTYLANRTPANRPATLSPDCLGNNPGLINSFAVGGLTLPQITKALASCNVNGRVVGLPLARGLRFFLRLIEAYVYARYPVMMPVSSKQWWPWEEPAQLTEDHMVLIIGVRRSASLKDTRLIVHDPGYRPFEERPLDECLSAACAHEDCHFRDPARRPIAGTRLVVVTDKRVAVQLDRCILALLQSADRVAVLYMLDARSANQRDYTFGLCPRDDLVATYFAGIRQDELQKVRAHIQSLPREMYWCVAGYYRSRLRALWLFQTSREPAGDRPWTARFLLHRGGVQADVPSHPTPEDSIPSPQPPCKPVLRKRPMERKLLCSVMSSSSRRKLHDLFRELECTSQISHFDLMVLRDTDVQELEAEGGPLLPLPDGGGTDSRSITDILAQDQNFPRIRDWMAQQCRASTGIRVCALATYFPDVTSKDERRRAIAVRALVNTMRLALDFSSQDGFMPRAIVEMVCGTVLDPCNCTGCKSRILEFNRDTKYDLLLQSLVEAVTEIKRLDRRSRPFAFGLELEPGETYVLNSEIALGKVFNRVKEDSLLRDHVGLNLDVAHVKIARIEAQALQPYRDLIVHAHICDHPRMHTKDQPVGSFTSFLRNCGGYYPYLNLLADRLNQPSTASRLPFSGAVALELEGCNRIQWIWHSLSAMRHMLEAVRNYA